MISDILKKINLSNYTNPQTLCYADISFNYYQEGNSVEEFLHYLFSLKKTKNFTPLFNLYDINSNEGYLYLLNRLQNIPFSLIQPHILNQYKKYNFKEGQIFLSDNDNQKFAFIRKDNNFILISTEKNNKRYCLYLLRDIIKNFYEKKSAIILHCAAMAVNDRPILIIGAPGAGKTTLLMQIAERKDCSIISNDRTIITPDKVIGFPMKIRIAKGTIDNNIHLYKSLYSTDNFKKNYPPLLYANEKIEFEPYEFLNSYKMLNHINSYPVKILLPNFSLETNKTIISEVSKEELWTLLEQNFYSIHDPIWQENILGKIPPATNLLQQLSKNVPAYKVTYNKLEENDIRKLIA